MGTEPAVTDALSRRSTSAGSRGLQGVFLDQLHPFNEVSYYQRHWQLRENYWTASLGTFGG